MVRAYIALEQLISRSPSEMAPPMEISKRRAESSACTAATRDSAMPSGGRAFRPVMPNPTTAGPRFDLAPGRFRPHAIPQAPWISC